jgi:uncharacterized protein involved in exopolysaccharide biosynthesis
MDQLQSNIDSSEKNYTMFKNMYTDSIIVDSIQRGNATLTVVSAANQPVSPISPRKNLNMAVGLLLGFMAGTFIVLFKAYWISSINNPQSQS